MQRYTINFRETNVTTRRLLVPFASCSTVAIFAAELQSRLSRVGIEVEADAIVFRLEDVNGPQLDGADTLDSVILDPRNEQLFASVAGRDLGMESNGLTRIGDNVEEAVLDLLDIPEPKNGGFKLRIITPALAQQQDISSIPAIERRLPAEITIQRLRKLIAQHLHLPIAGTVMNDSFKLCNCSFARAIHAKTTYKKGDQASVSEMNGGHSFLFIHLGGNVSRLSSESSDEPSLLAKATTFAEDQYGSNVLGLDGNVLCVIRADCQEQLPIVTLCSKSRHTRRSYGAATTHTTRASQSSSTRLDIHTAETCIATPLSSLTFAETGLEGVLVEDGVLSLYVVVRENESSAPRGTSLGKEAIFEKAAHWEPESEPQSERGMALFLSTLRVLCNVLGEGRADSQTRDSFLSLLHQLTNFPPAVRAMYILLRNETPTDGECATIAQVVYHLLGKYVPMRVINFDKSRLFETSRLFFGLMLEKVKHICRANPGDASEPYISSMKLVDLSNSETMEPMLSIVDTNVGPLEKGHLDAIKSGLLKFTDAGLGVPRELELDGRTRRAALLTGGLSPRIIVFDMDILYSKGVRVPSRDHQIIASHELDLSHLAVLCSRNGLSVVAPSRLANSSAPALTLDGNAFGAVYCGRQPCGDPGSDFMIYRPTRGGDTTIDPAVVTQLIAPVLNTRQADGSAVFDAPGDVTQRKIETPDEILMVCIDCSASMSCNAGFIDMIEDDPLPRRPQTLMQQHDLDTQIDALTAELDEVKEWVRDHESFDDVLRTIASVTETQQGTVAKQLLTVMGEHAGHGLKAVTNATALDHRHTWMWRHDPAREANNLRKESLQKFIVNIVHHEGAITDWLVFRSRMLTGRDDWEWSLGQPVPGLPVIPAIFASDALNLSIPDEYMCAITYELISDPVNTADGHTYSRQAIQQWLEINDTSPKTGLPLQHTSLTAQRRLARDINSWVEGSSFTRSARIATVITFLGPLGTFKRKVRNEITCANLYHLVFQALRGRHTTFELRVQGRLATIVPSDAIANAHGVTDGCTVLVALPDGITTSASAANSSSNSDKALIKVYNTSKRFAFSYWVSKSTKLTMASVLYKYWRKNILPWGLAGDLKALRTWTNMSDNGDGHSVGYIRENHEKLSTYLGPSYAKGCLEEEDVFDAPSARASNVLKVFVQTAPSTTARLRTSRMDVLKQMFDQFVNRTIAYNYNTHIGLITFSSTATVARALTDVVEDFRATVNSLQPKNDTAIWDGLALARHQIDDYSTKFPDAYRRILCITDGEDTKSTGDVIHVADDLLKSSIVVDSFCLGHEDHSQLLAVSELTGGYKFVPKTLSQAMAICELEPVLSLQDREDITAASSRRGTALSRFNRALHSAEPEIVNADTYPKRRAHPSMEDDVIELATAKRMAASNRDAGNHIRDSRLLTEIQQIIAHPHSAYDVYVSEQDISFFKVVMQGPVDSPYEQGTFLLYLDLVKEWPTFAPKARFVTPVHHPNVNANGRICHSMFDRNWTSDTSCVNILNTVYGLLLSPDYSDPVNVVATLDYHADQVDFADAARRHIAKHAQKTRAQWRNELLGHN